MKVKRKYCKPGQFILDEVDIVLLEASMPQSQVGGGAGTGETPEPGENPFGSRRDSTFVDEEDVEPEIWTGYIKYKGFE